MDDHLLRYDKNKVFVFIDCETFNLCLNSCHNLPWQVSMLKVVFGEVEGQKDFYLKWDTHLKIGKEAARITKYSPKKMEEKGLPPEECLPTVIDWLDNCDYIVGHNILGFDVYLIKDFYTYMGKDYKHLMPKIIDTNCVARGIKMSLPYDRTKDFLKYQYKILHTKKKGVRSSLTFLGREMEIEHDYENLHDAIVDLGLNLKIWNKLKWQIEI